MNEITKAATPKAPPAETNPSVVANAEVAGRRKRIPMSIPSRRLEAPEIPGYHCHWFLESNVPRALAAWYEFVHDHEVPIHQKGVGTDSEITGSQDLGTHIRVVASRELDPRGQPEYLVLMKLPMELWLEDRKLIDGRNAGIMEAIFQGEKVMGAESQSDEDKNLTYVRTAKAENMPLFNRPTRKQIK